MTDAALLTPTPGAILGLDDLPLLRPRDVLLHSGEVAVFLKTGTAFNNKPLLHFEKPRSWGQDYPDAFTFLGRMGDGWMPWAGGADPFSGLYPGDLEVLLRDGFVGKPDPLDRWTHQQNDGDVVAFRLLRFQPPVVKASPAEPSMTIFTTDELAQAIRRIDGAHDKGAGAIAEELAPWVAEKIARAADYAFTLADGALKATPKPQYAPGETLLYNMGDNLVVRVVFVRDDEGWASIKAVADGPQAQENAVRYSRLRPMPEGWEPVPPRWMR